MSRSADQLGEAYEASVPAHERHRRGQYFTGDLLAATVTRLAVARAGAIVLDPACGSGRFLLAAYDAVRELGAGHAAALAQIWGVEIDPGPAALAAQNLAARATAAAERNVAAHVVTADVTTLACGSPAGEHGVLPAFDAIVGNLPFIGFNDADRSVRAGAQTALTRMWALRHPALFGPQPARGARDRALRLDARSDYYVTLLAYALGLLAPGGRAAVITSTSWLDAGYAAAAQRLLMTVADLQFVIASLVEPWFPGAAVNVAVAGAAAGGPCAAVNFVALTLPLAERGDPAALDAAAYAPQTLPLVARHAKLGVVTRASHGLRVRTVTAAELMRSPKWMRFVRAPEIVLAIEDALFETWSTFAREGVLVWRGTKTGLDAFFYVAPADVQRFGIEERCLLPILKSPCPSIVPPATAFSRIFAWDGGDGLAPCAGAAAYVAWGATQSGAQRPWPATPSLRPRVAQGFAWHSLRDHRTTRVAIPLAFHDRMRHHYSDLPFAVNQRLVGVSPSDESDAVLIAAYLNSSLGLLFTETYGRTLLGDGALDLPREDVAERLPVPPLRLLRRARGPLETAFRALTQRTTQPWHTERGYADRDRLDRALLRAIGCTAPAAAIRDALASMIDVRIGLARGRTTRTGR